MNGAFQRILLQQPRAAWSAMVVGGLGGYSLTEVHEGRQREMDCGPFENGQCCQRQNTHVRQTLSLLPASIRTTSVAKHVDNEQSALLSIQTALSSSVLGLSFRVSKTLAEEEEKEEGATPPAPPPTKHVTLLYDFVVVGNGNVGQSAVQELQQQCPGATIALVDPVKLMDHDSGSLLSPKTDFFANLAVSVDPSTRLVQLLMEEEKDESVAGRSHQNSTMTTPNNTAAPTTTTTFLQYKCALLLASGSTGAPPPTYLVDKHAWPLVMELRPTMFPQLTSLLSSSRRSRPLLHPTDTRCSALKAAEQGKTVAILGSGWDAIELAVACSQAASGWKSSSPLSNNLQQQRRRRRTTRNRGSTAARPQLIYGGTGPLNHILPPYLVSAVAKRLKSKARITLQDRTLVRYVSYDDKGHRLGLYTAKAYDVLDSQRMVLDCLVVAPETGGTRGNALLPTPRVPEHLREASEGRPWYETWSQLSSTPMSNQQHMSNALTPLLMCYQDDGRIAVNAELSACSGVYAAGSVAKCGNALNGDAQVTGGGVVDAALAGQVAASNMARHYHEPVILSFASNKNSPHSSSSSSSSPLRIPIRVQDPCAVWRSDVLSYDKDTESSLASVGVTALCVGTCDAERYTTHGVFWTNQAAQLRFMKEFSKASLTDDELRSQAKEQAKHSPVYGIGVVFYMDQTGRIQGIMTWGLPIANKSDKSLKAHLVQQIKDIILSKSNGGLVPGSSESLAFFASKSQKLVQTAFSSSNGVNSISDLDRKKGQTLNTNDFPRPLHRYTPIWMTNLAFRKRRQAGSSSGKQGGTYPGEGLFAQSHHSDPHAKNLPLPPKPGVGFSDPSNQAFQTAMNVYQYQVWEHNETQFDANEARACPPREDALWIRKGFEDRNTNASDKRAEDFAAVLERRQTARNSSSNNQPAAT